MHSLNSRPLPQFVSARLYELRSQMSAGKFQDDNERMSMFQRLLKYRPNYAAFQQYMSDQDIISEGMGHTYVSDPLAILILISRP